MNDGLDLGFGDSQYVFTDRELNELLGVIEQKAAGADADLEVLDFFRSEGKEPLGLQFQPRSHKDSSLEATPPLVKQEELPMSALSSALASPVDTPALQQSGADQPYIAAGAADISILSMPTMSLPARFAIPCTGLVGSGASPFMQVLAPPAPQPQAPALPLAAAPHPPSLAQLLPAPATSSAVVMARFPSIPVPSKAAASIIMSPEPKGQISHSTVEKQRRDRINSLIDELRELVPPQQRSNNGSAGGGGAEGLEARRPKHVVLADTIQLLKHLQQKLQVTSHEVGYHHPHQTAQATAFVAQGRLGFPADDDTANSEGKSKGSSSHDDMEMCGAPQVPHIPCQMTQNSGVTVERGPDCYYVQVKCRDRKGLLSDIINALRQLPLEIRTAAVTTTNGTVRDVFEVKLDDPGLSPEDVQNLVHDVLFQQHLLVQQPSVETFAGKRPRA